MVASTGPDDGGKEFADKLRAGLIGYGASPFIEFERKWYSGNEITARIDSIADALERAGVASEDPVGMVVRNRVGHAAAVLGFIAARRPVAMIYSYQSAESIARDIEQLKLAAIIVDRDDWTTPVAEAVSRVGSAVVVLSPHAPIVELVAVREHGKHPVASLGPGGLHILTSGTTGLPRRVPVPTRVLRHTVLTMTVGHTPTPDDPPELVYWPFGSIGVCQLLAAPYSGKRMVLLEKFSVDEWVRAVKTYRVKRAGVQPAIVRMLLDADIPKEDLASLEFLPGGSGPLEPDLREAFEQRYEIPLLWAYGATEFAGSVCAWTPELYRQYGTTKRDSVGRPLPGVEVRVVDAESGIDVPPGDIGLLEARVGVIGPNWIRTTDLASMDADGFVTLHGRADGAINRGGFKILPETVRKVLVAHPAIRDACVVGVRDPRVGEVPFAAAEVQHGMPAPSESELKDWVRDSLPSHHIPVAIRIVETLPRNAALKVRPADVAALYPEP
jgi:long-chain acyl-CoA synthetase